MTVVSMIAKEFSRLDVMLDIEAGRISIQNACELLLLSRRQIFRLPSLMLQPARRNVRKAD